MKIHNVEQRSTEWYNLRKGIFSASEIGKFVAAAKPTAAQAKARTNLIYKKLAEMSGGYMAPMFETEAMRRGTELEGEARELYADRNGCEVEEVGFCIHDSGAFGCSPDGLVDNRKGLVEIKCPEAQTHIKYLFDGVLPDTYEMQVHMQLATTGAEWCDFFSYCPPLPPFQVRVDRTAFTNQLERGLIQLHKEFLEYQDRLADLWDEEQQREGDAA
jgi:putative phage-type endonuclease